MISAAAVEGRPNGCRRKLRPPGPLLGRGSPPVSQEARRVLDPLHRHALPARRRRGNGLLRQLGRGRARRLGGRVSVSQALRDVRSGRPCGDVRALAQGAGRRPRSDADAPVPLALPLPAGDDSRLGRDGERRHPLAGSRTAAVPALGAAQAGPDPLHGPAADRAPEDRAHAEGAVAPFAARGRPLLRCADEAARHGYDDGHLLHHRSDPDRRRYPHPPPGRDAWRPGRAGYTAGDPRALPHGAAHFLPRPVQGRRRQRLPGRPGPHGDRLRRPVRRWAGRVGAEDLLPARGPYGHDPGHHRRGTGPGRHLRRDDSLRDDRIRRSADRQGRRRPLFQARGRGHHLADHVPGHAQLLRRAGHGAPHGRAAALHLLRRHEPDRAAGGHGPSAQHRRYRGIGGARAHSREWGVAKGGGAPLRCHPRRPRWPRSR